MESIMAMRMVNSKAWPLQGFFFQFYFTSRCSTKTFKNSDLFLMSFFYAFNICFLPFLQLWPNVFHRIIEFAQMSREKKDLSLIFSWKKFPISDVKWAILNAFLIFDILQRFLVTRACFDVEEIYWNLN